MGQDCQRRIAFALYRQGLIDKKSFKLADKTISEVDEVAKKIFQEILDSANHSCLDNDAPSPVKEIFVFITEQKFFEKTATLHELSKTLHEKDNNSYASDCYKEFLSLYLEIRDVTDLLAVMVK